MAIDWNAYAQNPALDSKERDWIVRAGPAAEKVSAQTGVPVNAIIGQWALEADNGRSDLAQNAGNFAGIKAHKDVWEGGVYTKASYEAHLGRKQDSGFRDYKSDASSHLPGETPEDRFANDYVNYLQTRDLGNGPIYANALKQRNTYDFAYELGRAGYHTGNAGGYANNVVSRAERFMPGYTGEISQAAVSAAIESSKGVAPAAPATPAEHEEKQKQAEVLAANAKQYIDSAASPVERSQREAEIGSFIKDLFAQDPLMGLLLIMIGLGTGLISYEDLNDLGLSDILTGQGSNRGHGGGSTHVPGAKHELGDDTRTSGEGSLIRPDGVKVDLVLPKFDPAKYGITEEILKSKDPVDIAKCQAATGQYFADCAANFKGLEEGNNNTGPLVDWTMRGFTGKGAYWCAGFASTMYEGTGLYKYTQWARDFGSFGVATQSFRGNTLDGIEVGDTVVYKRGDGGHVGIVSAVNYDENGKVVSIDTIEGNKSDKVAELKNLTLSDLRNGSNPYLGYTDVSHREQKLIEMGVIKERIIDKLVKEYSTAPEMLAVAGADKANGSVTVVIDLGHAAKVEGGGAHSHGGVSEVAVMKAYEQKLKQDFEAKGYRVVLTSDTLAKGSYGSVDEALYERTRIANEAIGDGKGIYISLHSNHADSSSVKGAEMYYAGHTVGSEELSGNIATAMGARKSVNYGKGGVRNEGAGLKQWQGINPNTTAVLLEAGYLSNQEDAAALAKGAYVDAQTKAIVDSTEAYVEKRWGVELKAEREAAEAQKKAAEEKKAEPKPAITEPTPSTPPKAQEPVAPEEEVGDDINGSVTSISAEDRIREAAKAAAASINDGNQQIAAARAASGVDKASDKTTAAADKNPAEVLAMHNTTMSEAKPNADGHPPRPNVTAPEKTTAVQSSNTAIA